MNNNPSSFPSGESVLVITDIPSSISIEFGIDCISYETGPNFKGIGCIPKGLHFIYYSCGMSPRQGFFLDFNTNDNNNSNKINTINNSPNLVQVRSWNSSTEEIFSQNMISEESMRTLQEAMKRGDLNNNIGPYPYSQYHIWQNLSSFINRRVLKRCDVDIPCTIYPGDAQDVIESFANSDISSKRILRNHFDDSARVARFCDMKRLEAEIRERINSESSIMKKVSDLTTIHMNKSYLLDHMIKNYYDGISEDLLGELQLSFLLFVTLYSYPALEHWKYMIHTICCGETFLQSNELFTIGFIRMLYEQLNFTPSDFFEDELSKNNFLRPSLTALFHSLSDLSIYSSIYEHKKRLLSFITKKFNIEENLFDEIGSLSSKYISKYLSTHISNGHDYDGLDEYMPVIVGFVDDTKIDNDMDVALENSDENDEQERGQLSQNHSPHSTQSPHSVNHEINQKYSWRYPLLFESMESMNGKEDCFMTAARIIDEFGEISQEDTSSYFGLPDKTLKILKSLVNEARLFLEFEVAGEKDRQEII